ncbi:MAG: SMC-Scp complex subunit ScpB [Blastocatellia bacterium]|nr:SMC-Scp complex subunit ScpB [Blastocatellia bacterium]MCS7156480.1 SMC-Scp complex subunit ScpB [Blastocatellia bacterium]MCX7751779.1 SMC-Scp complex subunit ScpB [Blastocatellia bacterium]MDW8168881.1 SMC-Scp complex subunit ScpB [Acidobacteriota bacterium]MDW8256641.1 SMC-Scp complex subunit ScpB [Acidobacteriota bacterium]
MRVEELKPILEALIFVAAEPITEEELARLLPEVDRASLNAAIDALRQEYAAPARGLELRRVAGGYRISTRPEYHDYIRRYLKTRPSARLSMAALETLAVIAYKQPITLPEIQEIRGVNSARAVKTLLEKRLIEPKGRKPVVGRPILYGTSREFLIQFGLNDLSELPTIEDFEELGPGSA